MGSLNSRKVIPRGLRIMTEYINQIAEVVSHLENQEEAPKYEVQYDGPAFSLEYIEGRLTL